jgi:hypothetical protein
VINRPKAKAERILVNPIERAPFMCIRAATIPRCSGFTTDQIGGIMGHAADARGDVSDGRCRFRFWPVADILACSRHVGPQRQTGRGADSLGMSASDPEPDTRSGRGYLATSDQGRHLSSLKSASRLAKGLTAAGVGITSTAIIGLYWN